MLFTDKIFTVKLLSSYEVLVAAYPHLISKTVIDLGVIQELYRSKALEILCFENNFIIPLERIVIRDKDTTNFQYKHLCVKCSRTLSDRSLWNPDFKFTTMCPIERDYFLVKKQNIGIIKSMNFLWCNHCLEPLLDWCNTRPNSFEPINIKEYNMHIQLNLEINEDAVASRYQPSTR